MSEIKELMEEIKGLPKAFDDKVAAGLQPTREEQGRVNKRMDELTTQLIALQRQIQQNVTRDGKVRLESGPLAGMDLLDLRILERIFEVRPHRSGRPNQMLESVAEGRKALVGMLDEKSLLEWHEKALDRRLLYLPGAYRQSSSASSFKQAMDGWLRSLVYSRRALDSTTAGAGDELVPTFEAAELWMDVNLDTLVLPLIPQQTMPTNPFTIPRQFGDTNWYPIDENVQASTTDPTTGSVTLTAYGLKTGVPFSDELEEDAIIALVPEIRSSLARNAAQVIDDVLLNADTTTTDNINLLSTTISRSYAGQAHQLIGFDGLRHLANVDNTAQERNQNAAADAAMLYAVLGLLRKYGVARRRGEVVFICDPRTTAAVMASASLTSQNSFGDRATLSAGELREVIGIPWIRSDQMRVSSAGGRVSSTTSLNTTGNVLLVNTTQWRVGFRRQITMETDREAGRGQTTLYVSFRIGFTERTGTRSSATHTAHIRNITGV